VERSSHDIFEVLLRHFPIGTEEEQVRLVSVVTDIQTKHLPNTGGKCYCLSQLGYLVLLHHESMLLPDCAVHFAWHFYNRKLKVPRLRPWIKFFLWFPHLEISAVQFSDIKRPCNWIHCKFNVWQSLVNYRFQISMFLH
jgi:hypothetical protein